MQISTTFAKVTMPYKRQLPTVLTAWSGVSAGLCRWAGRPAPTQAGRHR